MKERKKKERKGKRKREEGTTDPQQTKIPFDIYRCPVPYSLNLAKVTLNCVDPKFKKFENFHDNLKYLININL